LHEVLIIATNVIRTTERLLIRIPPDLLESLYSTSFHIFNFGPIRLVTVCSECILSVSRGLCVLYCQLPN